MLPPVAGRMLHLPPDVIRVYANPRAIGRKPVAGDIRPRPPGQCGRAARVGHRPPDDGRHEPPLRLDVGQVVAPLLVVGLSPSVLSLRGEWDFRCYASMLQLPENILSFRSGFEKRPLPEMAPIQPILLDPPGLPFPLDPPHVPSEQPVLVYRRTCRLPLVWSSLRKRLVLHGVRSACHVFVNSKLAGYTQGSGLMADFVEMVRTGRAPSITGEDGLRAMQVALAAYESAKIGQPIRISNL